MIKSVFRERVDGDWDHVASFDVDNCEPFFADNYGQGAYRIALLIQESLEDDETGVKETSVVLHFNSISQVPDVWEGNVPGDRLANFCPLCDDLNDCTVTEVGPDNETLVCDSNHTFKQNL